MTPAARAFLDDLMALCERHQVRMVVDRHRYVAYSWMWKSVCLRPLQPGETPIDEDEIEDRLGAEASPTLP
jgi:hypothetical protein